MYVKVAERDADKVMGTVGEGGVYLFSKFLVVAVKTLYKPFCAKYMMKLTPWTKIDRIAFLCVTFFFRILFDDCLRSVCL